MGKQKRPLSFDRGRQRSRYHLYIPPLHRERTPRVRQRRCLRNPSAITGAPDTLLLGNRRWKGCSERYSPASSLPLSPNRGFSVQINHRLLLLVITVSISNFADYSTFHRTCQVHSFSLWVLNNLAKLVHTTGVKRSNAFLLLLLQEDVTCLIKLFLP